MRTPSVTQDTLRVAKEEALAVHLLPAWYEVDDVDSLARLIEDLRGTPAQTATHTRAFLIQNGML